MPALAWTGLRTLSLVLARVSAVDFKEEFGGIDLSLDLSDVVAGIVKPKIAEGFNRRVKCSLHPLDPLVRGVDGAA